MAAPAKQPPTAAKKSGGWGSVFSSAVAGLESRLDTILADDNEASVKARAEEEAKKKAVATPPALSRERDASRTRANDRLAERLAKATAAKSTPRTQSPSKSAGVNGRQSPAVAENGRTSLDTGDREVQEKKAGSVDTTSATMHEDSVVTTDATADSEERPIEEASATPVRFSAESSTRPSIDMLRSEVSSRPSTELPNESTIHNTAPELESELSQQRDEMHIYLEKIDALQSKLTYLAQQTVAAAKEANASSTTPGNDTEEARLAAKDEKIAQLMQEGEKLSKTELRHLQTIKKLRSKASEDEKAAVETRRKLEKAEQAERELKTKLRRAETAERQANDKTKQIGSIEKQVEELKVDRENASELVRSLTVQLKQSKENVERVEREAKEKSLEVDKNRIATLENDLEDAQIERKLAESRAEAELKKMREDVEGQKQLFSIRELELKNDIAVLETKVEAMRSRAEEASADGGHVGGESSVKLLRQVETLQRQYAVAKENWETIETSLNARVGGLEKERDELTRREREARKRVREGAAKARKAEGEAEAETERGRGLEADVSRLREEIAGLMVRAGREGDELKEVKAEAERLRRGWELELAQRIEEEKMKWQRSDLPTYNNGIQSHPQQPFSPNSGTQSPVAISRKASYVADYRRPGSRLPSADFTNSLHIDPNNIPASRPVSRRSFAHASVATITSHPQPPSPVPGQMIRQDSYPSPTIERVSSLPLQTPTIELDSHPLYPMDDSPSRTLADLVSTSTTPTTGPTVQLVERMSALVRRLESEKAATRDEMTRLTVQRDEARDEIVALMREVEAKRDAETKAGKVEGERGVLEGRYEAALQMLGEREEEVVELRSDVGELKRLYRELVEEKMGGK